MKIVTRQILASAGLRASLSLAFPATAIIILATIIFTTASRNILSKRQIEQNQQDKTKDDHV